MKVAEVKLDNTRITFYDDFSNKDVNLKCLEAFLSLALANLYSYVK